MVRGWKGERGCHVVSFPGLRPDFISQLWREILSCSHGERFFPMAVGGRRPGNKATCHASGGEWFCMKGCYLFSG